MINYLHLSEKYYFSPDVGDRNRSMIVKAVVSIVTSRSFHERAERKRETAVVVATAAAAAAPTVTEKEQGEEAAAETAVATAAAAEAVAG